MLIISMLINTRKARVTKTFDPDRSLGVLISDVARLLRRNFDRRAAVARPHAGAVARNRARVAREGMNQVALAECLEIQPITVARLIDRMEAAGWIERRNDPLDRRAVRLFLTAKCQPVLEEIHARAAETIAESVLGVAASTQNQVFEGLQRIKQNLVTAELKTSAADEPIGRTNRDAGRKPTRIQRTR